VGRRVAVLRHPMPYGDLFAERVQRFATMEDLDRAGAEEREEYEPISLPVMSSTPASTTPR
jgi:predicted GTPase